MSEISRLVVCDTETTGFDPETCELLEVAACGVRADGSSHGWSSYVEYEGDIPPDARGTHHIGPEDVAPGAPGCQPREKVLGTLHDILWPDGIVPVFHNAAFDVGFLPGLQGQSVICTYRCAKHLWPDAPNFKNQTLRYYRKTKVRQELMGHFVDVSDGGKVWMSLSPHRALYDAAVTLSLVECMLEEGNTVDDLLRLTREPVLLKTVGFGKHKGELWEKVPRDYLAWMRRSGNFDSDVDVMHTLDVITGRKAA